MTESTSPPASQPLPASTTTSAPAPAPAPAHPDRGDLIHSAIRFLSDPTVAPSPLPKKIAFLESKGLTSSEIEQALRQSSSSSSSSIARPAPTPPSYKLSQSPGYVLARSTRTGWSWKDWVLGLVFMGAFSYSAFMMLKTYLPSVLDTVTGKKSRDQQARILALLESRSQQIEDLTRMLKELNLSERQYRSQIAEIRSDLNSVASHHPSLSELMSEVTRVKSLILNHQHMLREAAVASSSSSSSNASASSVTTGAVANGAPPRTFGPPKIPAWQQRKVEVAKDDGGGGEKEGDGEQVNGAGRSTTAAANGTASPVLSGLTTEPRRAVVA